MRLSITPQKLPLRSPWPCRGIKRRTISLVGLSEVIDCFRQRAYFGRYTGSRPSLCLTVGPRRCYAGRIVNSDGCRAFGTYWGRMVSSCGGPIRTEYTIFEHTVSQRTDPFHRVSLRTKAIADV